MFGEYRIVDDVLFCILNKNKPKKPAQKFRKYILFSIEVIAEN